MPHLMFCSITSCSLRDRVIFNLLYIVIIKELNGVFVSRHKSESLIQYQIYVSYCPHANMGMWAYMLTILPSSVLTILPSACLKETPYRQKLSQSRKRDCANILLLMWHLIIP